MLTRVPNDATGDILSQEMAVMAMTPAQRQQRYREKAKAGGLVRRELMLPADVDRAMRRLAEARECDVSDVAAELVAEALKARKKRTGR
jgi:hypothetical protein